MNHTASLFQTRLQLSTLQVDKVGETNYYDSVTGKLLYTAPRGRTFEEFKAESKSHGWPSFRDSEVTLSLICHLDLYFVITYLATVVNSQCDASYYLYVLLIFLQHQWHSVGELGLRSLPAKRGVREC